MPYTPKSRESVAVAFNDDGWGDISRAFTKAVAKVAWSTHQFEKIENTVKTFSRGTTWVTESLITNAPQNSMDNNDHTNLVAYDTGSDENDMDEDSE